MIENIKQYELAWSEFIEWCEANSFWLAPSLEESRRDLCKDDLRHLLADLQQFLDEKGIYCDAFISNVGLFWPSVTWQHGIHDLGLKPTRPEALTAAVTKGMEILNDKLKNEQI